MSFGLPTLSARCPGALDLFGDPGFSLRQQSRDEAPTTALELASPPDLNQEAMS
jgi:hypothetical protein